MPLQESARAASGKQPARGTAGAAAPRAVDPAAPDAAQDEVALQLLRRLISVDRKQGIAAVDQMVASARGPSAIRTAMLGMSELVELVDVDDPAIDGALRAYGRAEPRLLRLHAAKLLGRPGRTRSARCGAGG